MLFSMGRIAAGFAAVMLATQAAAAAEITVYSNVGVKSVLDELFPKFEKASGHKLTTTWSTSAVLTKRIQAGEMADVLILVRSNVDTLLKDGKIAARTDTKLPKASLAVAVKNGAPKPDIATPEALKSSLLAAKAISYSNPAGGSVSGVFFAKQLERLGIAEPMKAKTKFPPPGAFSASFLVSGEADFVIQMKPELLATSDVEIVGPLPGDMDLTVLYAAGVGSGAKDLAAAKALIEFLTSPDSQTVFKARGFDPA